LNFGRSRFAAVVSAQINLFEREQASLLGELPVLLERYNRADRDAAEESFGDYTDAVAAAAEILEEMRDHYAATLDDAAAYVRAFNKAVRRRLPVLAPELDEV
jgi:hypothetical protein